MGEGGSMHEALVEDLKKAQLISFHNTIWYFLCTKTLALIVVIAYYNDIRHELLPNDTEVNYCRR